MKIGAQLYTVREFTKTEQDLEKTFKKIAQIGYTGVQVSAIGEMPADFVKKQADDNGLKIIVTHTAPSKLINETKQVIETHKTYNAKYVGLGALPQEFDSMDQNINNFITNFKPVVKQINEEGLKFMYHNHAFEFEKFNGKLLLDYLIDAFSPKEMGFILDTYWVQYAGADPVFWLKKLKGRIETIHLKDMKIVKNKQCMSEVFEGNMNFSKILSVSEKLGVKWAFVEQDDCNGIDPFDCLETSFKNIKKFFK